MKPKTAILLLVVALFIFEVRLREIFKAKVTLIEEQQKITSQYKSKYAYVFQYLFAFSANNRC